MTTSVTGSVMRWSQNEWKENWLVVDSTTIRVYRSEENYTSGSVLLFECAVKFL